MNATDEKYCDLIDTILIHGEVMPGRNGSTYRLFTLPTITFETTPLVTIRKTAWKKAIMEMEWFLSGNTACPPRLLDWWQGQLNPQNHYIAGYSEQLTCGFNQIKALIDGIQNHPYSRRHVITTWNPYHMHKITKLNQNPNTPTTCHTTIAQFFVSKGNLLSMRSYQRSADMLLGVPHNWIQSWALLQWLAAQTDMVADKMLWTFGDAHIYQEPSHLETARAIANTLTTSNAMVRLDYNGTKNRRFYADDFEMMGEIPAPIVLSKPKRL